MVLHVGDDVFVDASKIVMILNLQSIDCEKSETQLRSKKTNKLKNPKDDIKSLVMIDGDEMYQSHVDTQTLRKRQNVLDFVDQDFSNLM
ncbi:MAG: DUF370 domain-containing protein [Candidatus Cloacimonetes bacterium]|nr:DUF370 domain-containing protein [Candidatus Cloacimonadota bacterium]